MELTRQESDSLYALFRQAADEKIRRRHWEEHQRRRKYWPELDKRYAGGALDMSWALACIRRMKKQRK